MDPPTCEQSPLQPVQTLEETPPMKTTDSEKQSPLQPVQTLEEKTPMKTTDNEKQSPLQPIQTLEKTPPIKTPETQKPKPKSKSKTTLQSPPTTTRLTRSKLEPEWTIQEMLTLVGEISALNKSPLKTLPSDQKWKMISENCNSLGVIRSINQCRRKWDNLLVDHKKIKDWESQSVVESYWTLPAEKKKELELPGFFDKQLSVSIDDFLMAKEAGSSDSDMDDEVLISPIDEGMVEVSVGPVSVSEKETHSKPRKSKAGGREQEMVGKLREGVQLIHMIMRGELSQSVGGGGISLDPMKSCELQTQFTRQQGDDLIKVLGILGGTLDQFVELVKESR